MNRVYLVRDARGERALHDTDLPLTIGGADVADLVLPDFPAGRMAAYLALAEGHVFLQPADESQAVFHNHERLHGSAWLKSGDLIEIDSIQIHWHVRGDQVVVDIVRKSPTSASTLVPPAQPPNAPLPESSRLPHAASNQQRRSPLRYLAWGLLSLLLLVALFVLFATPVRISVEPKPDDIALHGSLPPIPVWGRYLALPGEYTLHARRQGYQPLFERLDVQRGMSSDVRFELQALPGLVTVELDPPVVFRLTVDGQEVAADEQGRHPIQHGTYRIGIDTDRHLPEEHQVTIEGFGKPQRLAYSLSPGWANVHITTEPAGAAVQVDGESLGETPLDAEIMHGERTLQLALAGHKTLTLQQSFTAGEALSLEKLELIPSDGQLQVQTEPAGATVSVDGKFQGRTPVTLTLASHAEHRVSISKSGHVAVAETVTLQPEEEQVLQVKLRAEMGTVFINSQPADASLLIDGEPAGSATRRLRLSTRTHTLEIRKPGFITQRIRVTPRAGASQSVDVALVPSSRTPATAASVTSTGKTRDRHTTAGGHSLNLVRPDGSFTMGASRREPGRRANESPRQVELTRPFYLGDKEVSNAQFRRFRPAHRSGQAGSTSLDDADQPVVNVGWDDAARYCNWLSQQEGLPLAYEEREGKMQLVRPVRHGYRLPTEAEWAYAARVYRRGETARYPWVGSYPPTTATGNYADARIADTLAEVVPGGYDDGYRGSAPVGTFAAGPAGFFDLSGNVAEWVNDYYTAYPSAQQKLVQDPLGPVSGQHHVVRGSSWRHASITELRLSYRDYSKRPRQDLGFRVARYADE